MGPSEMDRPPDFPETFAGLKYDSVDENVFHSVEDKMSDMKHILMEPKHENIAVDSFLGLGMDNIEIGSKMEEFSHGFDFSFLPDYGGLDYCSSTQDVEAGLKLEILDGFLDEVDEVEDIYASHDLSPGVSDGRSIGLSKWSKEALPNTESKNVSSDNIKDTHCFYASEDDKKPLSNFISSWGSKRGKNRNKNLLNTARGMSNVSYDFRPRKGPMKKYIHTSTENTLLSDDDQLTSSESEDDVSVVTNKSKNRSDRRKHQRMWTVDEVVKLVDGISHFGVGKWTDIKNLFFHSASYRTPVDIRDKWRNLLKASYNDKRNGITQAEEKQRSGTCPIPKDILHRVRELASIHPYPLSKSLSFAHDSSRSLSISRKKKRRTRRRRMNIDSLVKTIIDLNLFNLS